MKLPYGQAGQGRNGLIAATAAIMLLFSANMASAQNSSLSLRFSPDDTNVKFTIGDSLHTIHGSFRLKSGEINYDRRTGAVHGLLIVDAQSGQSGSRIRDRRMHREILETSRFPEISFRPDRVDGNVAESGTSAVQVHGTFSIHGADHELTLPARVQLFPDHWIADLRFNIPYVKWGIKNPSTFLLRVSESVEIDVHAAGRNPFSNTR